MCEYTYRDLLAWISCFCVQIMSSSYRSNVDREKKTDFAIIIFLFHLFWKCFEQLISRRLNFYTKASTLIAILNVDWIE